MATVGNLMHFIGFCIARGQPVAYAKWCNSNSLGPTFQTFVYFFSGITDRLKHSPT